MVSSTFNSDEPQPPRAPWRTIVIAAALLVAVTTAGVEYLARQAGFRPTLQDDADLWCSVRARVRPEDPSQVLLVGTSRMEMDVDPEVLGQALGTEAPLQLAAVGSSPIPTLKHIAEQTDFHGSVICEVFPGVQFHMATFDVGKQQLFVEHWESRSAVSSIERSLATIVQSHSTLRLLSSSLDEDGHKWYLTGASRLLLLCAVLPDRAIVADFRLAKIEAVGAAQQDYLIPCIKSPISPPELAENFRRIESWTQQIQSRGGRVIFVRMPVSAAMFAAEERVFPRADFWARFVTSSSGHCIYCAEHEVLRKFDCPDGSHLDGTDRAAFSRALAEALRPLLSSRLE